MIFINFAIYLQGGRPLKERILLKLHIERNLENLVSHSAPDWRIQGALSSVHCSLDLIQYKLIRGILEHNLGEKLEEFKRPMMSHLQDPKIEVSFSTTTVFWDVESHFSYVCVFVRVWMVIVPIMIILKLDNA